MTSLNKPEMAAHGGGGGGDRLSDLPDAVLTRILSHLPTDEAARTSALSRRWRRVHAAVPVVHLVDERTRRPRTVRDPVSFEQQVTCALLSRDAAAPIRALRVSTLNPSAALLDQWLLLAMSSGAEEIDVALKGWNSFGRRLCPFVPVEGASADFEDHVVLDGLPRRVFAGDGGSRLRCLRLTNCRLDLPSGDIRLASLETLLLKRIIAADGAVQRVISASPRLADLTLEQCPSAREITVPSARLRSLAVVCCHNLTRVALRTPCLRSLRYRGALPGGESFLSLGACAGVTALSVGICEDLTGRTAAEAAPVAALLDRCTSLAFLHLSLRPSMTYLSRGFLGTVPWLPVLRRLELRGYVAGDHTIHGVANVLQRTGSLEQLSLFFRGPELPKREYDFFSERDSDNGSSNGEIIDYSCKVHVPKGPWKARIRCLQRGLRRINVVDYRARPFERALMKLLLSKAELLNELAVIFDPKCAARDEMKGEMSSWLQNQRAKVTFAEGKDARY
ncbi:hypothetical protein ACP70R_001890 [Stipagrostis hirtigluma subsp. patula]